MYYNSQYHLQYNTFGLVHLFHIDILRPAMFSCCTHCLSDLSIRPMDLADIYILIAPTSLFLASVFLLTDVYIQLLTGSLQLMTHSHIRLKILKYIYQHHPSPMFSLLFFSHSKNGIIVVQPPKPKNFVIFSTFFILLCIQLT